MKKQFEEFIKKKKLFGKNEKVLLTVSGGVDSVVMCELFHQSKFNFGIAHCNFQLREKESDEDEKFVERLAKKHEVSFFSKKFDTKKYAKEKKVSIQMAARDLRYNWFKEVAAENNFTHIATAHHLNDSIETFFINLVRGTGIDGLTGVPLVSKNIIRPLLFASKREIEKFASENKIKIREDSSNKKDDFMRNKIRHHLIPLLEELNPNFIETMRDNLDHISFAKNLFREKLEEKIAPLFFSEERKLTFKTEELKKLPDWENYFYYTLDSKEYRMNLIRQLIPGLEKSTTGKIISSNGKRALINRGKLIIEASVKDNMPIEFPVTSDDMEVMMRKRTLNFLTIEVATAHSLIKKKSINHFLDKDLLKFPLSVREWEPGDYIIPLGMKGRKKLSDFFVDEKINRFEKENICVLLSVKDIVCIIGHRIDERYKITPHTKNVLMIEVK